MMIFTRNKTAVRKNHFLIPPGLLLLGLALLVSASLSATKRRTSGVARESTVSVPFVGCASDGQTGPVEAPRGEEKALAISTPTAQRLAYYKAEYGLGTLGPRGWHCFGTYGSDGSSLYLSPEQIHGGDLFSQSWKGFTGPAIHVSVMDGDTSGRFVVARTIARVFPDHMKFVKKVIAEGIEPAADFPTEPYTTDKLTYRSKEIVEYETPPNDAGLGTESRLVKNAEPIRGVAILFGEETSLAHAAIRLEPRDLDLVPVIVGVVEREAKESAN